jgi:uncharacterized protein YndB with AHSA1/START domain
MTNDYTNRVHIAATPERVFGVLTDAAEYARWWAPATGTATARGELRITFDNIEAPLVVRVAEARHPETVAWDVLDCAFLPDWVGTRPVFTLGAGTDGGCDVRFRHEGLSQKLECYEMCRAGWDQYLPSLRDYIETGAGRPFTRDRLG